VGKGDAGEPYERKCIWNQRNPVKKFMFTSDEIDRHKQDRKKWHDFVRRREAEIAFFAFANTKFHIALELGAGDGGQSVTISQYCENLICTDKDAKSHAWLGQTILERQLANVEYKLCDAQDLSQFEDGTFNLIFSSNLFEHVPDIRKCLKEYKRVLRDDGIMLHTMPSRWWKFFSFILSIVRLKLPGIHGVTASQWQEFNAFGIKVWKKTIESLDLNVTEIIGLPFYVGHGNQFIPVIKAGNALKISASYLYVIKKR